MTPIPRRPKNLSQVAAWYATQILDAHENNPGKAVVLPGDEIGVPVFLVLVAVLQRLQRFPAIVIARPGLCATYRAFIAEAVPERSVTVVHDDDPASIQCAEITLVGDVHRAAVARALPISQASALAIIDPDDDLRCSPHQDAVLNLVALAGPDALILLREFADPRILAEAVRRWDTSVRVNAAVSELEKDPNAVSSVPTPTVRSALSIVPHWRSATTRLNTRQRRRRPLPHR